MKSDTIEISQRGRRAVVPMRRIDGHEIIATGRWPIIASIRDEEWIKRDAGLDPLRLADDIRTSGLGADIFEIADQINQPLAHISRYCLRDNAAVIATDNYDGWWKDLPQEARKNTRRAARMGVQVEVVALDAKLAADIKTIYDESPIRQGRNFWHYGKDVETILRENGSYSERSTFLGAYFENQLIGFAKVVYVGGIARLMQIVCMAAHQDKRPIIALIVKTARHCHEMGIKYLVYSKYTYNNKADSSITEFKRRLGFEPLEFYRHYIPLTAGGRLALMGGAHKGWRHMIPPRMTKAALQIRAKWLESRATGA